MCTITVLEESMGKYSCVHGSKEGLSEQTPTFLSKLEVSSSWDIELGVYPGVHLPNAFSSNGTSPLCWNSIFLPAVCEKACVLYRFVISEETIKLTFCCFAMVSIKKFVLTLSTFGTKMDEYSGILSVG